MFVKIQVMDNNTTTVRESIYKYQGQDFGEIVEKLAEETAEHLSNRRKEWLTERKLSESSIQYDESGDEYVVIEGYEDFVDGEGVDHPSHKEYLPNYINKLYA
jgi:hypothetical protein